MTVRQEDHTSPRKREEKEKELEGPSLSKSLIHNDQPPGPQQVLWVTWHPAHDVDMHNVQTDRRLCASEHGGHKDPSSTRTPGPAMSLPDQPLEQISKL